MYKNIDLKAGKLQTMFFPIWIARRFIFVLIPMVIFKGIQWAQIISVLQFQILYLIYYGNNKCHSLRSIYYLHLVNEFMILMIIYSTITWSDFVLSDIQIYENGFAFALILVIVLVINISQVFKNMIISSKTARKIMFKIKS